MPDLRMCATCRTAMIDLLEQRIRKILEVAEREAKFQEDDGGDFEYGQSHCFHLVELQAILRGQYTCGVFDDHGPPPTVKGPLFERREG